MRTSQLLFVLAGLLAGVTAVAEPAAPRAPEPFKDGDVVCFVGDSITHGGRYHGFIYAYYLTRFPDRKIRFANCGISGDSAGGALQRLEWDVFPHQPTVASLMLGMNDVGRGLYGKDAPDEANLAARRRALDGHRANMEKVVAALVERCHPRLIFTRPSPYDQTVQVATPSLFGVNEALDECGKMAEEMAGRYGGALVDLHGPMTALNLEGQKKDPAFTVIGGDRVHPGDVGHLVMAYLYLKAQGVPVVVADLAIDARSGRVTKSVNGEATAVKADANGLTFEWAERALPWPLEKGARPALNLVPLEKELNQERLSVANLAAGRYRLSIDGQLAGEYAAEELAAGINLAFNEATPQYKQAQEVLALNRERWGLETRLRSVAQIRIMLERSKVNTEDAAAVDAYFADFLEKNKASGNINYFKGQFENYVKTRPAVPDIQGQIERLTRTCWERNQPKPHRYEITRLQ